MKEKLTDLFKRTADRIKNAFSLSPMRRVAQAHEEELFIERDKPRPFVLAVLFTGFKFLLLAALLVGCAGFGLVLGVAKAYVDTTPELDIALLTKSDRTSYIYDRNGNLLSTFAGLEYRDWANSDEIPDMLKNAVISIEDVRFYKHNGVDYKRLFAAVVGSLSASSDAGGSTLTQQLVKNRLLTNEVSYKRKIQEAYLALEIEKVMEKDKVLEAYLNDVYLGQSNYGMKAASKDYFGKALTELTIRECAMLAGMIQSPNTTDPRKNTYERTYTTGENAGQNKMDVTDARTDKVINRMYSAGFISKQQRDAALADTVTILKTSVRKDNSYQYLYYIEYALRQISVDILEQRGMLNTSANRNAIENELSRGGYNIYLCIDPSIQSTVQETLSGWDDYPGLKGGSSPNSEGFLQPQAAAVVIDQRTGELRAVVGGRDEPEIRKGLNRAYQSTQMEVGSSIKPLTVYGPALDLGLSPGTAIANIPEAIVGWDTETGYPNIGSSSHIGIISMRRAVVSSLNVAAARTLMEQVTPALAAKYLVNLGVDSSRVKATGSGLALGTTGITPIEMAAAYATIANGGTYQEPIAYSRVVDANGKVILDAKATQETRQVYKPTTAWMLVDMLTDAVKSGTGTNAQIRNMTVAGKTGTNQDDRSAYFAGMTGYYTAVVWVGDDDYSVRLETGSGGKVAAPLWQAFMSKILSGLPDRLIIDSSPVELGLVQRTVCSVSGMLATDACYADTSGHLPVTEWFAAEDAPSDTCNMHVLARVCSASGQPASVYCPADQVSVSSLLLIRPTSALGRYSQQLIKNYLPNAVFTDLSAEEYVLEAENAACSVHSPFGGGGSGLNVIDGNLEQKARSLIDEVRAYLSLAQNLSDTDRGTLETGIAMLEQFLSAQNNSMTQTYYERLRYNYAVIYEANPPAATAEPGGSPGSEPTPDPEDMG